MVLGSDSAATFAAGASPTIGQQMVTKVHDLRGQALFTSTGAIGISQTVRDLVTEAITTNEFKNASSHARAMKVLEDIIRNRLEKTFEAAASSAALLGTQAAGIDVLARYLVAARVGKVPCLFELNHLGVGEEKTAELPFVALGSGQMIADPFLAFLKRILWSSRPPTVAEGRFVAAWTIIHAVKTNPGGIGGSFQLSTLSLDGDKAKIENLHDSAHHTEMVLAAEKSLKDFCDGFGRPDNAPDSPRPP